MATQPPQERRETGDGTGDRGRETGEEWKDGRQRRWNEDALERGCV
jgi:hypothetical protein